MEPMQIPQPFSVVRKGPRGKDSHKHTFGVVATANSECVRLGYSEKFAMLNGSSCTEGIAACKACEKLAAELNKQFARYWHGEFHA